MVLAAIRARSLPFEAEVGDLAETADLDELQRPRRGRTRVERDAAAKDDRHYEMVESVERVAVDEGLLQPAATDDPHILFCVGAEMTDQRFDARCPRLGIGGQV
jgi:hypothetical protein